MGACKELYCDLVAEAEMDLGLYVLDGHTPIKTDDISAWGAMHLDMTQRRVAETTLPDGTWISTVFLGTDHNWGDEGPPILFETMVFPSKEGPKEERDMERAATWEEAESVHAAMVAKWSAGAPEAGA